MLYNLKTFVLQTNIHSIDVQYSNWASGQPGSAHHTAVLLLLRAAGTRGHNGLHKFVCQSQ